MKYISDEHYVNAHSAGNAPAAYADSGEIVVFQTRDCFNRTVKTEKIPYRQQVGDTPDNPATGPLYVNGAEPGDVIAVDILNIDVADHGVVAVGCGPFSKEGEEGRFYILPVKDGRTRFQDVDIPIDPMIGVIGTAVPDRDVPCINAFEGGGNMDSRLIRKGATVWLPVRVPGALLSIGDLHAVMGDGEVCGTGLEIDGEVTVRIRLVKNFTLNWPVTETRDSYYVNTCGDTCGEAIHAGYMELRRLIAQAYGWSLEDAGIYMTLQLYLESNQACLIPHDTFRTGIPKVVTKPRLIG